MRTTDLIAPGRPLLVLLSGGADSCCLLHLAVSRGAEVGALHVNYGLRGPDSDADEEHCRTLCARLGVPLTVERVRLPEEGNLQAEARAARYALAERLATGDYATGHTRSDQAETVLYRLATSPGRRALLGMEPRRGRLVRPLLEMSREDTRAYCREHGIEWREDASNADPRFARARLRRLTPLMERAGLTPERLGLLAARARRAEDALEARIATVMTAACVTAGEGRIEIDGTVLRSEPDAIVLGVVTRAIVGVAGALTRPVRLERFEARILGDLRAALDRGGALRMTLGGALIDVCPGGRLVLTPEPPRRRSADREC